MGLQPGVYVLIFDGQATRSNWTAYMMILSSHTDSYVMTTVIPMKQVQQKNPVKVSLLSLPMVRHLQKNGSHADGVTS